MPMGANMLPSTLLPDEKLASPVMLDMLILPESAGLAIRSVPSRFNTNSSIH